LRASQIDQQLGIQPNDRNFGRRPLVCAIVFALLYFSTSAQAQTAAQKEAAKKKTAVNFEDQLIQGELNKPDFFYFLQKKQFNFGRLIKLRENFLIEMKKTSEEIERRGGG
jgi:hypothetical protein